MKYLFADLIAVILKFFYLIYYSTIQIRILNGQWTPQYLVTGQNCIYTFWHSKSFLMLPYGSNANVGTLTLLDWKNIIFDRLCNQLHYHTVPVTNSFSAALRLRRLLNKGYSIGLALDGPRGPAGMIKPGAWHLSKITHKPIVIVNLRARRSYRLCRRWDRYEIPFPFSSVVAELSAPFYANDLNRDELSEKIRSFTVDR